MKKLDNNDYDICRFNAKLFETSLNKCNTSSPIFIRRFLNSEIAKSFDNKSIMFTSIYIENIFDLIEDEYGASEYGKVKYSAEELYWMGFIYRVICIYYNLTPLVV